MTSTKLQRRREAFREKWLELSIYERFEHAIGVVLSVFIAVIIFMALLDLAKEVLVVASQGVAEPLDHKMFQAIFGKIMTVLIALEFKHSVVRVVAAGEKIIQVKTVLLIAILALARKFIILDPNEYSAATILALAAVVIGLGVSYWLVRESDSRQVAQ